MFYDIHVNGKKSKNLFRTNIKTSDPFKSYANTEYEKRRKANYKEIIDEINRQNLNDYGV